MMVSRFFGWQCNLGLEDKDFLNFIGIRAIKPPELKDKESYLNISPKLPK